MSSSSSSPTAASQASTLPKSIHLKRWPIQIEHLLGNTTCALVMDFENLLIIFDSIKHGTRQKKKYPITVVKAQKHETHANQLHLDIDMHPSPSKSKRLLFGDLTQRNTFYHLVQLLQRYGGLPYQLFQYIHGLEKDKLSNETSTSITSTSTTTPAQTSPTPINTKSPIPKHGTLTRPLPIFNDESTSNGLSIPITTSTPSPDASPATSPRASPRVSGSTLATSIPNNVGSSPTATARQISKVSLSAIQATSTNHFSTARQATPNMISVYHQCIKDNDFAPFLIEYHQQQQDGTDGKTPRSRSNSRSRTPVQTEQSENPNPPEIRVALNELLSQPGNDICADCTTPTPTWASINLGIFICIKCSGVHRNLGTHITFVRSIDMDKWDMPHIHSMIGNNVSNDVYEYYVPSDITKPHSDSSGEVRQHYINAKYKDKAFHKDNHQDKSRQPPVVAKPSVEDSKNEPGMVVTSGILMITLIEGKNLLAMDLLGKSDPWCQFSNGRQTVKSKTINNTLNPDFKKETLSLCVDSLSRPVVMQVWDADRVGADQLMGTASIDISKLKADQDVDKWYSLDTQGSIHLQLSYTFLM